MLFFVRFALTFPHKYQSASVTVPKNFCSGTENLSH